MAEKNVALQFAPFSSFLDGGFWHQLCDNKLNVYGLDDSVRNINGSYYNGDALELPCRMNLDHSAFHINISTPARCFTALGCLYNKNTLDDFKQIDKKVLLDNIGHEIWDAITSGQALQQPQLLSRFLMLTYADLKKYHFYYWFAFPCVSPTIDFTLVCAPQTLTARFNVSQIAQLVECYNILQSNHENGCGYFIIIQTNEDIIIDDLINTQNHIDMGHKVAFAFADPCTLPHNPGWPLRNYLALVSYQWGTRLGSAEFVCFRYQCRSGSHDISHSLVLNIKLSSMPSSTEYPKCIGWEKNERQKLGPRMVNLSASMDPVRLAESAVDLNLKLMRWRLLPGIDLDSIAQTKCLLLGAGTLGCNVARCLLGWGVRNITFVDNGYVSYSNPVRQTLFVFDDCKQILGGRPKAEAAAESLKKIFPGVISQGVLLSIPMPGHTVTENMINQTKNVIQKLDELVAAHDVVFLLLDTRESRWLPTVMAASKKKIVICSALGFESYLVMRHGCQSYEEHENIPSEPNVTKFITGDHLGCYFCNDVVAPGDSTRDRTLDQQCTVSRPGLSFIVSALAVELLMSVLQHPAKGCAPGETGTSDDQSETEHASVLGIVPHQIRGFLSTFQQIMPASRAFNKCTACSKEVIRRFEQEGFEFLLKVFNEPCYLEDLTGLTQMHDETADSEVWDYDDEEDFSSMD